MKTFIIRAVTGILFVLALVGAIIYSPVTFGILFTIITALTIWELAGILNSRQDIHINRAMSTLAGAYLFVTMWFIGLMGYGACVLLVPYIAMMLYLMIAELYKQEAHAVNNWAFTMMTQIYVAIPFGLLNFLEFLEIDQIEICSMVFSPGWLVLFLFVFLWCSDTGAYCTGSLIGKHKLFPSVSPAKTWEGSIGGGVLALVAGAVFDFAFLGNEMPVITGMAAIVVVFGTLGDLVESLLKRRIGIKDSGNILPGHGGMLDRFDSALIAIPAIVAYFLIIPHIG